MLFSNLHKEGWNLLWLVGSIDWLRGPFTIRSYSRKVLDIHKFRIFSKISFIKIRGCPCRYHFFAKERQWQVRKTYKDFSGVLTGGIWSIVHDWLNLVIYPYFLCNCLLMCFYASDSIDMSHIYLEELIGHWNFLILRNENVILISHWLDGSNICLLEDKSFVPTDYNTLDTKARPESRKDQITLVWWL